MELFTEGRSLVVLRQIDNRSTISSQLTGSHRLLFVAIVVSLMIHAVGLYIIPCTVAFKTPKKQATPLTISITINKNVAPPKPIEKVLEANEKNKTQNKLPALENQDKKSVAVEKEDMQPQTNRQVLSEHSRRSRPAAASTLPSKSGTIFDPALREKLMQKRAGGLRQ